MQAPLMRTRFYVYEQMQDGVRGGRKMEHGGGLRWKARFTNDELGEFHFAELNY